MNSSINKYSIFLFVLSLRSCKTWSIFCFFRADCIIMTSCHERCNLTNYELDHHTYQTKSTDVQLNGKKDSMSILQFVDYYTSPYYQYYAHRKLSKMYYKKTTSCMFIQFLGITCYQPSRV